MQFVNISGLTQTQHVPGYDNDQWLAGESRDVPDTMVKFFRSASTVFREAGGLTPNQAAALAVTPATVAGNTALVRAMNTAAITDAFNRVVAAGSGVVRFVAGAIYLAAPLAMASGVVYEGQGWKLDYTQYPDSGSATLNESFGTVLVGDGTFDGAAYNTVGISAAAATALYGAPGTAGSTAFSNSGLTRCGIRGIGFKGFKIGVHIGAQYRPGCWFPDFDFATTDCTQWGYWLENFMHHGGAKAVTMNNAVGQGMVVASAAGYLAPGNGDFQSLLGSVPQGVNNLPIRGLVFAAYNGGALGSSHVTRPQCNRFSQITRTGAATMSNGSANIGVTDLTSYDVGMPVVLSASVNGFLTSSTYFVLSRSGVSGAGDITLGTWMPSLGATYQPTGYLNDQAATNQPPPVVATGNAAVNIIAQGFPCAEYVGFDNAFIYGPSISAGDYEGGGTARVFLQRVRSASMILPGVADEPLVSTFDVVGRNVYGMLDTPNGAPRFDFSADCVWQQFGQRGACSGSIPMGLSLIPSSTPGSGRPAYGLSMKAQAPATDRPTLTYDYWQTQNLELQGSGLQLMRTNDPVYNTGQTISSNVCYVCFSHNDPNGVLPTITASLLGLTLVVANLNDIASIVTRDGVATLSTAAGQKFNNSQTQLLFPAHSSAMLQARYGNSNNTGQFYWAVVGTSFPYSALTDSTGTPGAATQYTARGRVRFAAAATSLVVTHPACTVNSSVFPVVSTVDATAKSAVVVPAAGSFTITLNAAATAATNVDYVLHN